MHMWCIGGGVIAAIVVLPKLLELLIGSQRQDYEDLEQKDESKEEG